MKKFLLILLILSVIQIKAQCWKTVAAGVNHTVALKTDNTLWAWGSNFNGQLGNGSSIKNIPTPIQIDTTNNWQIIVAGDFHTVAIKTDGTLWAWGEFGYRKLDASSPINKTIPNQIGTDTNWKTVSAGGYHTVAIKTDGTIWAWGDNAYGQLGDRTKINKTIPVKIGTDNNWQAVSAGKNQTIAIKTDGTLWGWGINSSGQLGDGTFTDKYQPTQIGTSNNWKTISTNFATTAIKTDGTLWAWGANSYGQLGDGTNSNKNTPTQIGTAYNWQTILAGNYHSVAIKTDGTLWTCGQNYYGQLGDSTKTDKNIFTQIGTETNWKNIIAGSNFTLAIKTDNTLFAWGFNDTGKLGDGTIVNKSIPTLVDCLGTFTFITGLTNLKCTGSTDGSASISSVSGGTAPYIYLWSNGATTNSITGLVAGDYSCTITDATSLSVTKSFTITQPTAVAFITTSANTCNTNNNGSITATATGGTTPYQYAISPGFVYQPSNIFAGLSTGTYTVNVKDTNGCIKSNIATVNNTPPPTATTQSFNFGATIAQLQVNGLNIKWYNAATGGTTLPTATVLQTAKYYVSQTVNGCESARVAVDITITSAPVNEQIQTYVPTNGLLAYYPFNGNANDISINANNGIATDVKPTSDRFGNSNSAYSFNGTSSNVEANVANYPLKGGSRTITGWFKAASPIVSQEFDFCLLNYGNLSDPNYWFKISFYNKGYLDIQFDAKTVSSQENYFNNKWTFFALTFDSATETYSLYINNVFKMGGAASLYTNGFGNLFRIGRNKLNNYFEGSIDDIGVWNRVLTPEEITGLYNSKSIYTLIPDLNFEKKLIALGVDSGTADGKVLTSSVSSLTSLSVSVESITNLTGIQDFVALRTLNCGFNNLTSLDVSKNVALTSLYCFSNKLTTLDVSKNVALTSLSCYSNPLTTLDVSKNVALTSLVCSSNQLTTLDVSKNVALTSLGCSSNQLTTLDVSKNVALTSLGCSSNQLTTLDVSKNVALTSLECSSNQLKTLDISQNIVLKSFSCGSNQLTSLNLKNGKNTLLASSPNYEIFFKNNPNLSCIQVDDTAYSNANWATFKDVTANYSTNCSSTSIIISSEFEDKLIALGIDKDGKNGSVLLSDITNVTSIDVSNSGITNLSGIENFGSLETLICKGNVLITINLSSNTALKYLDCSNNPLIILDVSKNILLTELYCNGIALKLNKINDAKTSVTTQLTVLDLSNNLFLTKLNCSNNQLVSLDVSKNTFLTAVDCSNNSLQNLNVNNGNNNNMVNVNFKNNTSLSCIKVDSDVYSNVNWIAAKDPSAIYSKTACTLGVNDFVFDKILLYPNPVKGQLHIDNIVLEKVTVYDALGKLIKTKTFTTASDRNTLDLADFAKGAYFIYLQSEDTNIVRKVIVE